MSGLLTDRRILLVDDQRFVRTIVKGILKQLGCNDVHMAQDGTEAIEKMALDHYDATICDIKMRPMNGLQLVKSIRSGLTGAAYDIPVVMLTGHPEERFVKAAMELHVNAFCIKPVTAEELGRKLIHAISNPQQIEAPIHSKNKAIDAASNLPDGKGTVGYIDRSPAQIAATKQRAKDRIQRLPVGKLAAGQILADSIKAADGTTLLHRGVTLTDDAIRTISSLSGAAAPAAVPVFE